MIAYVQATSIPGLFDVQLEDGSRFGDLTIGQLRQLATAQHWTLVDPSAAASADASRESHETN